MIRVQSIIQSAACAAVLCSIPAVRAQRSGGYGEYQVILDQQLLGKPAPVAPPVRPETPAPTPAPSWATEYRLTMITEDLYSGKVRVGLTNVRDQSGFLLIEGEPSDQGFALVSADLNLQQAEITYQGLRHVFSLESASLPSPPPENPEPRNRSTSDRSIRRVSRPAVVSSPQPPEPAPTPRFSSPEELQAHLQSVQMDAIRTGKPPLPIPLTPEMDAQLVQEGVLPPLEQQ